MSDEVEGDGLFEVAANASSPWVPPASALLVGGCGAALLLSGALPASRHVRSLAALEVSHFSASLIGLSLLVVAHGLWRRLDAAHRVAVALLLLGALALFGRGELGGSLALLGSALLLAPFGRGFYRQSSLLADPLSVSGWLTILAVFAAAATLATLRLHHAELRSELWWRFALDADAPRFLRAFVCALVLALAIGLVQVLRPESPRPPLATEADLARARPLIAQAEKASSRLALVGDKALLFGEGDRALLSYAVEGRAFVALGDPLGPAREATELAWAFKALADRHRGWACFYEVTQHHLPRYLDLGLTLRKVGEEAVVPLSTFSLDGPDRAQLRQSVRKVEKEQVTFEVVGADQVPPLLDALESISNDWLARKGRSEKGFSIGYFDRNYLSRTPVALVRKGEQVVAFANLWATDTRDELEIDLMRQTADAPRAVMDYLFIQLMLWAKREGYARFSLGGAPFSGLEDRALAPAWHRLGAFVYRHGESFYGFRGVRQFKEKFRPEWEPRYLASPGGLALPRVLQAIAALGNRTPSGS